MTPRLAPPCRSLPYSKGLRQWFDNSADNVGDQLQIGRYARIRENIDRSVDHYSKDVSWLIFEICAYFSIHQLNIFFIAFYVADNPGSAAIPIPISKISAVVPLINLKVAEIRRVNRRFSSSWRGAGEAHMSSRLWSVAPEQTPCEKGIAELHAIRSISAFGFLHIAGRAFIKAARYMR